VTLPIYPGNIVTVRTNDPDVAGSGFKNAAGVLTDPTTVTLVWRRHGEADTTWTVTAGQIVKDSVGVYHADIPVTEPGLHYFRWVGTGAVVAAAEGTFSAESYFVAGVP
jgi:hypothetical protein